MAIIRSRARPMCWPGCSRQVVCATTRGSRRPTALIDATWSILGDPTEASVIVAARKALIDPEALAKSWPRLREYPFESRRKRMSTLHRFERGTAALPAPAHSFIAFVKGAPREIWR